MFDLGGRRRRSRINNDRPRVDVRREKVLEVVPPRDSSAVLREAAPREGYVGEVPFGLQARVNASVRVSELSTRGWFSARAVQSWRFVLGEATPREGYIGKVPFGLRLRSRVEGLGLSTRG